MNIVNELINLIQEGIAIENPRRWLFDFINYFDLLCLRLQTHDSRLFKDDWLNKAYKLNQQIIINGEDTINDIFQGIDNICRFHLKFPFDETLTLSEVEIMYK